MKGKECPVDGCGEFLRSREATEIPTLVGPESKTKTVFIVKYCNAGHIEGYYDVTRQMPENAPARAKN